MNEQFREHQANQVNRGYWSEQYNATNGPDKIAARRELNYCLAPDVPPVHFEELSRNVLYRAGVTLSATVLDIGCGFPKDLGGWLDVGHEGHLIGLDPNKDQFNGIPYTPQSHRLPGVMPVKVGGDAQKLAHFLSRMHDYPKDVDYTKIDLYEASAHQLPFEDESIDVVQWLFSTYALDKAIQATAFSENTRVLRPDGRTVIASSGADNKARIRDYEVAITEFLNNNTDLAFMPPIPVNAWNTSEDVEEQLLNDYERVYVYRHHQDLVFDSLQRLTKWYRSFWTLQDRYIAYDNDHQKITPTDEQFEISMMAVLGPQIEDARRIGKPILDLLRQDLFIASNNEQHHLPDKFEQLK